MMAGDGGGTARRPRVAVVGGGPAGLAAAERLVAGGCAVEIIERMPSPARKLLLAGRGGLNLTHSEPLERLLTRYGANAAPIAAAIRAYPPEVLVAWATGLGQETFVGSSGRVFPQSMKSSPLVRAWLARLGAAGVKLRTRTRLVGFDGESRLLLESADGSRTSETFDATVLALGGASWPRLGADGSWVEVLRARGVAVTPLTPANAGVRIAWSDHVRGRFAGQPLKRIAVTVGGVRMRGEAVVTAGGLEGSAIYAAGPALAEALAGGGPATLTIDLRPDMTAAALAARLALVGRKATMANRLRKAAALAPAASAVLREAGPLPMESAELAARIKAVTLTIAGLAGIERAISTAGGVAWSALDERGMLRGVPGVFAAGEMLDWTAPTGGYLLQACFASGHAAAEGVMEWLRFRQPAAR